MNITVLFLGPARDIAGVESTSLVVAETADMSAVRAAISAKFPQLRAALPTMRIAVNQSFVSDDHVLRAGDEVALIPPVSGG